MKAHVLLIGICFFKQKLWKNWIVFAICCNTPCKAQEYVVIPHVKHLYVLLPLVMPHVDHMCVLLLFVCLL